MPCPYPSVAFFFEIGMTILQPFTTEHLIAVKAIDEHFSEIETVLIENRETLLLLSAQLNIQQEAEDHINCNDLPPNGLRERVRTFLLLNKELMKTTGFLSMYLGYPKEQTFYIGSLFFRPSDQRKGYGQEVVKFIEKELQKVGYIEGRVAVGLKNWPALRFWSKQGYDKVTKISGDQNYTPDNFGTIELCNHLI